ncbi:hypothetical protein HAX54_036146 [Datura stramonium]|uniref:BED-type domain-containing protein n=1 Tax=Datura stramonium TaxID=4076 RepID=A0ABS8VJR4_DATST|nr:hypothetical protein [Datura stramonium]
MADKSRISDVGSTDNSIDNSLDTQIENTKKRKEMQSRSGVLDHFDNIVENDIGREKCKYYKNNYAVNSSKNGTTGLKQYLARCKVQCSSSIMPPKFRSLVWKYFEVVKNNEEGRKARFLRCGVIYNCDPRKNGTRHLKKHVERCLEHSLYQENRLRI